MFEDEIEMSKFRSHWSSVKKTGMVTILIKIFSIEV